MESAIQKIADLLEQAIGLTVTSIGASTLQRALNNRKKILAIESDEAYLEKLTVSFMELRRFVEEVVVPETWFYRDQEPFKFLTDYVHGGSKDVSLEIYRILSLPCSTGEEPYSIAMTLFQAGLQPSSFYIDAVDVSNRSLTKARNAVYTRNSFRTEDKRFRDVFFQKTQVGYSLNREVKEKVRFVQGNILQPGFLDSLGRYDIIFCRNLLIYFNRETQEQAIKSLYGLLVPDGLLFTGHSEASLFMGTMFEPVAHARAFAFRKRKEIQESVLIPGKISPKAVESEPTDVSAPPVFKRPRPSLKKKSYVRETEMTDEFARVSRLADSGDLAEAATLCEKYLQRRSPSAKWFYLLGVIRDSQGKQDEAIKHFRKAVYLDPGNVESLTQLALLAERRGNAETAENYKRRIQRVQKQG